MFVCTYLWGVPINKSKILWSTLYYVIVHSGVLSRNSSFALFLALNAISRWSFAGNQRFVSSVPSVVLTDPSLSRTQGILSVGYPTELRGYHQEPPRPQGHQSYLPRVHGKDCESTAFSGRVCRLICMTSTGNFPCERGIGLRHQDGRGCLPEEGRSDTSWPAGIWIGERGRRPVWPSTHGHERLKHVRFVPGRSRDPARRIGAIRAAAECC